jgi:hypothetical protein
MPYSYLIRLVTNCLNSERAKLKLPIVEFTALIHKEIQNQPTCTFICERLGNAIDIFH